MLITQTKKVKIKQKKIWGQDTIIYIFHLLKPLFFILCAWLFSQQACPCTTSMQHLHLIPWGCDYRIP